MRWEWVKDDYGTIGMGDSTIQLDVDNMSFTFVDAFK